MELSASWDAAATTTAALKGLKYHTQLAKLSFDEKFDLTAQADY